MSPRQRNTAANNILAILSFSAIIIATVTLAVVANGVLLRQTVYLESHPGNNKWDRLLTFVQSVPLQEISVIQDDRILEEGSPVKLSPAEALSALVSVRVMKVCYTQRWREYSRRYNSGDVCTNDFPLLDNLEGIPLSLALDSQQAAIHLSSILGKLHTLPASQKGFPHDMSDLQTVDLYALLLVQWAAIQELESRIVALEN